VGGAQKFYWIGKDAAKKGCFTVISVFTGYDSKLQRRQEACQSTFIHVKF